MKLQFVPSKAASHTASLRSCASGALLSSTIKAPDTKDASAFAGAAQKDTPTISPAMHMIFPFACKPPPQIAVHVFPAGTSPVQVVPFTPAIPLEILVVVLVEVLVDVLTVVRVTVVVVVVVPVVVVVLVLVVVLVVVVDIVLVVVGMLEELTVEVVDEELVEVCVATAVEAVTVPDLMVNVCSMIMFAVEQKMFSLATHCGNFLGLTSTPSHDTLLPRAASKMLLSLQFKVQTTSDVVLIHSASMNEPFLACGVLHLHVPGHICSLACISSSNNCV